MTIVDASVILAALFPDESQPQAQSLIRDHIMGRISLCAPELLSYEVINAVWQAVRRKRIDMVEADSILDTIVNLDIRLEPTGWKPTLFLAHKFDRSAYDAAYLSLAQDQGLHFVTGDLRLYNAVKDELSWVIWVGDYRGESKFEDVTWR